MKVAIRVDASAAIGTGHFMRCLALATHLRGRGARCDFFCRQVPEHLRALAVRSGHDLHVLGRSRFEDTRETAHSSWLHTSQRTDADQTLQVLSADHWSWVVVDHYALDAAWESRVASACPDIMVIDDLADRPHQCRLLLDQNLYSDSGQRYCDKVPADCKLLLGPVFALLRREFSELRRTVRRRTGPVRRILVQMGGIDNDNQTLKALEAIAEIRNRTWTVDVVIGEQHPARDRLEVYCRLNGHTLHVQTTSVARLMAAADLAIGAAGSSSWERCCLGLPTICIVQAANQSAIAQGLQLRGAVVNLGDAATVSVALLSRMVASIADQSERLATLSAAASEIVDGMGTERVAQRMMEVA